MCDFTLPKTREIPSLPLHQPVHHGPPGEMGAGELLHWQLQPQGCLSTSTCYARDATCIKVSGFWVMLCSDGRINTGEVSEMHWWKKVFRTKLSLRVLSFGYNEQNLLNNLWKCKRVMVSDGKILYVGIQGSLTSNNVTQTLSGHYTFSLLPFFPFPLHFNPTRVGDCGKSWIVSVKFERRHFLMNSNVNQLLFIVWWLSGLC